MSGPRVDLPQLWEHDEFLSSLHARVLRALVTWFAIGEAVTCVIVLAQSAKDGALDASIELAAASVPLLIVLALIQHWLTLNVTAVLFLAHLGLLSSYLQSFHGLTPATTLATVAFMLLAGLLFGVRGVLWTLVAAVAVMALSAVLVIEGWVQPWGEELWNPRRGLVWLRYLAVLLFLGGGVASALTYVLQSLLQTAVTLQETLERERSERSRREATQRALERARRLEALAQFAGGLAHDFNNSLTLVVARARSIATDPGASSRVAALAAEIEEGVELSADTVRSLLSLGRRDASHPQRITLRTLLQRSEAALRVVFSSAVQVQFEGFQEQVVCIDVPRVQQALLNLALNARDAMPDGGGFHVRVSERLLDDVPVGWRAAPGRYVVIACVDTGLGMDESVKERLFEPFFTTKGPERGTGLGLAMVRAAVYDAYGFIEVTSQPCAGTTVLLYLPRMDPAPGAGDGQRSRGRLN